MTREKIQEYTRRISQANTTDMVVIIYDIALSYLDEASESIRKSDKVALNEAIIHVRKCINELIGSLHYDYSPAGELLKLYIYCSRQLVSVSRMDRNALESIYSILSKLRDAYASISSENKNGPVMVNSESVYAGLTYGKGILNEDIVSTGNRGYLV